MQKIKLEIVGITYSQTQSGSYVLTLAEDAGKRKLPIVIGGFEAQAIAVELEKMVPNRPLTHDLIKSFCISYGVIVTEVIIYKFLSRNVKSSRFRNRKIIERFSLIQVEIEISTRNQIASTKPFF